MSFEIPDDEQVSQSRLRRFAYAFLVVMLVGGLMSSAIVGIFWFVSRDVSPIVNPPTVMPTTMPLVDEGEVEVPNELETNEEILNAVDRIAYITPEGQVAAISPDGSDSRLLTDGDLVFQFPAWSPDGHNLAVIGGDASGLGVYVLSDDVRKSEPQQIYFSSRQTPFYLYWSPDSQNVSFLANHPTEILGLHLAPVTGVDESRLLATGSPFYWDWSADGEELLIHSGFAGPDARLMLIDTVGNKTDQVGFIQVIHVFQ